MRKIIAKVEKNVLSWLQITRVPVVKVYDGYGDAGEIMVCGHVLKWSPLPRTKYRANFLANMFAVLRLFIVIPKANARVRLEWDEESHETQTEADGFFQFEWKPVKPLTAGWHKVRVSYLSAHDNKQVLATGEGVIFIPHVYQYACISDIDDTFLISHSTNLRKRLFVLLTENAQSRKPFEGVVNHYQLLSKAGATEEIPNPFFYVSSSEWNLYDYIKEFCRKNEMPPAVLLLSQLKRFKDFWKTGQGKHATKYVRIARIIKSFPNQKYILLGDDSQSDPEIYSSIVRDFPTKIFAVYLRKINRSNELAITKLVEQMKLTGVFCCYFSHSAEAIEHSRTIGLIP